VNFVSPDSVYVAFPYWRW